VRGEQPEEGAVLLLEVRENRFAEAGHRRRPYGPGAASSLLASGDLRAAYAGLAEARAAWRGEPYEGLGEHSWLVLERRRCAELSLHAAELYAETGLRLGHDAAAVALDLTGLAERHPTHERLAVLLAVALYRSLRQDDALRVLRSTRDHLRDLAGLDPGPELQRTERLMLAQEPDQYRAAPPVATADPIGTAPVVSGPGRGYPLVGRGRPRAVLDAAAEAAGCGHPTTALLVGEAASARPASPGW
jgi:hypothetical protein